jgi:hypothetical protein
MLLFFREPFKMQWVEHLHGAQVGIGTNAIASWEGICGPQLVVIEKPMVAQLFQGIPRALWNLTFHR